MFYLDTDGEGFPAVGNGDPVVAGLQRRFRGLRPVQHPSPYKCAARAIIQHRLSFRGAAAIAERIAFATARRSISGTGCGTPSPPRTGSPQDERFTAAGLRAMPQDEAMAFLQGFPEVGPPSWS